MDLPLETRPDPQPTPAPSPAGGVAAASTPMPPTYPALAAGRALVAERTEQFVRESCRERPHLAASVIRLLDADHKNSSIFRLLPLPVLGALTDDPEPALPICVLARLWWTGADVFDDLNDGDFSAERTGISAPEAAIAAVACLGLLPSTLIARSDLPPRLRGAWIERVNEGNLDAANGQLADVSAAVDLGSLLQVLDSYADKSGSACARDLAMTAELAGVDDSTVASWGEFGRTFGVLRQLANDRKSLTRDVSEDEDLANGTRTLLLAHALDAAQSERRRYALRDLSERARHDVAARAEVRRQLTSREVVLRYDAHVTRLGNHLRTELSHLAAPSPYRAAVEWMVRDSVDSSLIGSPPADPADPGATRLRT